MMPMSCKLPMIRVIDIGTDQVLMEVPLEEAEKAYAFIAEMEEMGLDLKIENPTLADTLSQSLGLSPKQAADYKESMDHEIEDHDGSCCFTDEESEKKIQ